MPVVDGISQQHSICVGQRSDKHALAQVLLWSYPGAASPPLAIRTMHLANIFGVRFLPCCGNTRLVTGAMDCYVQLHVLDAPPGKAHALGRAERNGSRWRQDGRPGTVPTHTTKYMCHSKRVKVMCRQRSAGLLQLQPLQPLQDQPGRPAASSPAACVGAGCGGCAAGSQRLLVSCGGRRCAAVRHPLQACRCRATDLVLLQEVGCLACC